ncbi:tRNA G18 (ribose-2'-O)-methylase SpoU [Candidatus Termititenax persephonae]|uniref:tRNA G18 (Ribose-2'-O)-methylase SpoU n=1 Tax=Candidatus Termititenax persephonae TaxID=2218525 RepID=A0A388TIC7_9BACT|nr:tRNA G18 (ribose-2'-O)-methylase SpoU [Candidatus Termititenax persephonae]
MCAADLNIKKILSLHEKNDREEAGLFLIEGRREIDLAVKNGVNIVQILDSSNTSAKNLARISYRGEIVAVAEIPRRDSKNLVLPPDPLVVVLDRLEKPGNIGAILRTAEAAGVNAVLVCGGGGDLCNPNLIRASLGAVFSIPVFCLTDVEAINWLDSRKIPIIVASPYAQKTYFTHDFKRSSAVIIGSEADGVSEIWSKKAAASVAIPMRGAVDSLNASVSAATLIYEALRQRHENP